MIGNYSDLPSAADQLWRLVRSVEAMGLLTIVSGKRGPYDAEWKNARLAFVPHAEPILRVWLARPPEEPAIRAWRAEVEQQANVFPDNIEALLRRRITIPGHSDAETVAALARIGSFAEPLTLRQLSALIFRGDSKRLDDREDLIRTLFPEFPLRPRPLVVAVRLPLHCQGVLFIENQDNYAAAIAGRPPEAQTLVLVYAAGFRSGAQRVRERKAAILHYTGNMTVGDLFEDWWFEGKEAPGPLHFFGDLDFSGMGILAALRDRFGNVTAWQPGYEPLLERLRAGQGHAPDAADKRQQTDPGHTGCPYADTVLLPAAREWGFIDQESVSQNTSLRRSA